VLWLTPKLLIAFSAGPAGCQPTLRVWWGVLITPERHRQICLKLLDTLHITSEDRRELGGQRLLFSALLEVARVSLDEVHFMPALLRPDHEFEGVVIEKRDNNYLVHECHEIGVGRYSPVKVRVAKDLADALRAYVRAHGGTAIDGVPINFAG
jgi:hypothetical protein